MPAGHTRPMHLGVAHHLGWAVTVLATADHRVVDRRRVELIEPGLPPAPIHHEGGPHEMHRSGPPLDDAELAELTARVSDSVLRSTSTALDQLEAVGGPIESLSVRDWPSDFPDDVGTQRRAPFESRADSIMYCRVLAELGVQRGWTVYGFEAKSAEAEATELLGSRAESVLHGPRAELGSPWAKDHRMALAATVLAVNGRLQPPQATR